MSEAIAATEQQVALINIRIDGGTQSRAAIDDLTVDGYAELMQAAVAFPPVVLFFDGDEYWLADGFHRYHAATRAGLDGLVADVRPGTRRDAILYSVGANKADGLPRTKADKRNAVSTLLNDDEWKQWSDREIARRCGVSADLVGDVRRSLPATIADVKREMGRGSTHDRTTAGVAKRRADIAAMAGEGHSSRQIAAALRMSRAYVAQVARDMSVDIPADRAMARTQAHDPNRIVESIVMDAENLTADVGLITFSALDRARLRAWIDVLIQSRRSLDAFIRQLTKEWQSHGEAA